MSSGGKRVSWYVVVQYEAALDERANLAVVAHDGEEFALRSLRDWARVGRFAGPGQEICVEAAKDFMKQLSKKLAGTPRPSGQMDMEFFKGVVGWSPTYLCVTLPRPSVLPADELVGAISEHFLVEG